MRTIEITIEDEDGWSIGITTPGTRIHLHRPGQLSATVFHVVDRPLATCHVILRFPGGGRVEFDAVQDGSEPLN